MKRNGCLDGCLLLALGGFVVAIAAAVAIPMFVDINNDPPQNTLRNHLHNAYKECAIHLALSGEALPVRDLDLTKWLSNPYAWEVYDFKTGDQLDLNAGCNETKVLGKLVEDRYGNLAYSLNLGNGVKSCVTRSGEKRDNWSCK